jgi:hypothetical protein
MGNSEKLAKAIAYLRERNIYVLESKFRPSKPVETDVARTWAKYRSQTEGKTLIKGVK